MTAVQPWLADALVVFGTALMALAAFGSVRMSSVYLRINASTKLVPLGVMAILFAAMLSGQTELTMRVWIIALSLLLTAPASAYALARLEAKLSDPERAVERE